MAFIEPSLIIPKEVNPQQQLNKYNCFDPVYYSKLLKANDIGELLYYISKAYNIQLNYHQQKHFDLLFSCKRSGHYIIADCMTGHRSFIRTPCNSFFCKECQGYSTGRVKRNAKKYLWNCNHLYATFTLPPEIQRQVYAWNTIKEIKQILTKKGIFKQKNSYYTDLTYKAVDKAIKRYCKKYKLETGYIIMPHSYGSNNLNWFFHLNVLISSKAINKEGEFVDHQFNYDELREFYKEALETIFKVSIRDTPQIKFATRYDKQKKKRSIYIHYRKSINIVLDYFRHIPLSMKNIKNIEGNYISYQTSKQKKNNILPNRVSLPDFFKLVIQHIPPKNFRTIRQYGLYSNHNKKRKKAYPTNQPKPPKPLICQHEECKTILDKNDFVGRVHNGNLVWLNIYKLHSASIFFIKRNSILDYKGFEGDFFPDIDPNGRLRHAVVPPPDMKPLDKPQFPSKNVDLPYSGIN